LLILCLVSGVGMINMQVVWLVDVLGYNFGMICVHNLEYQDSYVGMVN
jgi:hypothetical protein